MFQVRLLRASSKYLVSTAAIVLVTGLLSPFVMQISSTTVALAYLLVVLFTATLLGSRVAIVASVVAVACYNFFFLPPLYTFQIADTNNWVALVAFFVTAIVAGQLSSYARRRADESEARRVEIEALYDELRDAFERESEAEAIKRSEKLKSALLDAITHDLRTPLTSIKASASSLVESKKRPLLDDETQLEFLQIIIDESDRLNAFIQGMVGIAKVEANALRTARDWITVQDILSAAIERAKDALESHRIHIELEEGLPVIRVSASSISEAVYLLLDNAAKYSPEGSPIRIVVKQLDGQILIHVDDQGRGIPPELREHIFKKFVRGDESVSPSTSQGLGIGLAIAQGLIEAHQGKIWVDDAEGDFKTRFSIELPIGEEEEGEIE